MEEVHLNIKKLRELKGITRETMCAALGIGVSGYAKIERGETDLTLSKLIKIAEVLEVDVPKLLNFDANRVFNISNNNMVQGTGADQVHLHNHVSNHTEKYIEILESENLRLKSLLQSLQK